MSKEAWHENVLGSIGILNREECVWVAPACVYDTFSYVTSPVFYLYGRRWRIGKEFSNLFLRIVDWDSPYPTCNVTLTVKNDKGLEIWCCTGVTNPEYGFKVRLLESKYVLDGQHCTLRGRPGIPVEAGYGIVKIFCKINKQEYNPAHVHPHSDETTDKVDSNTDEEEEEKPNDMKVKGVERLTQNFKNLLADGKNSDVILKAGDREFRVHKGILGARSPVFDSMFELDMKEKTSGIVDIPDCTAESFEVFLLYLYTGSAETMTSDNVSNLFYAADKYRVDDLKEECVQFMKDNMSVENFCDTVALSIRHRETGLLKEATRFFRQNIKKIIKTVQWQTYLQENSTHANELLVKALDA